MATNEQQRPNVGAEAKTVIPLQHETLQIGNLRVHMLAFDHVDGPSAIPGAIQAYRNILTQFPGALPLMEYFPPEIEAAIGYKPPADGKPISAQDEFANINASYGAFVNQAGIDRVLVVDPAFSRGFWLPEGLPWIGGMILAVTGGNLLMRESSNAGTEQISRREALKKILRIGGKAGLTLSGFSTFLNQTLEDATGYAKGYNPPDIPGALISETDFRILTISRALEQMGESADQTGIRDVVLIYPQAHIDRIKEVFAAGGIRMQLGNLKFDIYAALYHWQQILNIRDWRKNGSNWTRTSNTPINFVF